MIDWKLARTSVAAAAATGSDFLVFVGLVSFFKVAPALATGLGCLVGALVNFTLNRIWAFESKAPLPGQVVRYALVSGGSLLLNAGGVQGLLMVTKLGEKTIWWIVRGVTWAGWNYPMHRYWVFR